MKRTRLWAALDCLLALLVFVAVDWLAHAYPTERFVPPYVYVMSFAACVLLPAACAGRTSWRIGLGAALAVVWCVLMFTETGQRWACDHDPFQDGPCQVLSPQPHAPSHLRRGGF